MPPSTRVVTRVAPTTVQPSGGLRAGAARVDITPGFLAPLTGWGFSNARPMGAILERFVATALVLEDKDGHRVALVAADLHAGSRLVTELVAARTAALGIGLGELFLSGTHTHSGPGNFYGSVYFDENASCASGVDFVWVDWLVDRLVQLISDACRTLRPAVVGFGNSKLSGWSRNRSLEAHQANFPGAPRPGPDADREAVDPLLRCLWAEAPTGEPIGAYGTFGAHGTVMPGPLGIGTPDWFGVARRFAESELAQGQPLPLTPAPLLGLAAGVIGGVDPAHPQLSQDELLNRRNAGRAHGAIGLLTEVGEAVGLAFADACLDARTRLKSDVTLETRYAEPQVRGAVLADGQRRMSHRAAIGTPTLAGSEMGRGAPFLREGDRDILNPEEAQWPKRIVEQRLVNEPLGYQPDTLPLRLVRVGPWWLAGFPGEPTVQLAEQLRGALVKSELIVCAVTGDYAGYFTTTLEYGAQHYEGGSTLWGRWCGDWLVEQFHKLAVAAAPVAPPAAGSTVTFPYHDAGPFRLDRPAAPGNGVPVWPRPPSPPVFDRVRRVASGSWRGYAPRDTFELGRGPWLEVVDADTGVRLSDDQRQPMRLSFNASGQDIEWCWEVCLDESLRGRSVVVRPCGPAGFTVAPPQGSAWPRFQV